MNSKVSFISTVSQYRSAIMGLSMLSIMLFHQCFTSSIPFNLFHNFGYWGVDIFLFLSGMGLVKSLNNNSLNVYYLHRFKRIIPSCLLCGSMKYTFFILLGSSVVILRDGLNIGIWSIMSLDLWFIPTIIILYAISPLLYQFLSKWTCFTITIVLLVFFFNGFFIKPKVGYDWLSPIGIFAWTTERLPVFLAGMFIVMRRDWIDGKIRYSIPFLIAAIGLVFLEKTEMAFQGIQACRYFALMIGMPALISLSIITIKKIPNKFQWTINFFGIYSLELYLVHEFIFWSLKVIYDNVNPFILIILGFLLSCLSAYICKRLIEKFKWQ